MTILYRMALSLAVFAVATTSINTGASPAKLKVVLRYDDYSDYTSIDVAESLIESARSVGGGLLVGVIPFPYADYPETVAPGAPPHPILSQEKVALLKRYAAAGAIEIAVHGFSHRNNVASGRHSEFSGLPERQQALLLRTAKESLETATGATIRAFVPPFNQYDEATLRALKETGFELVSAGMGSFSKSSSTLRFLPSTTYIDQLEECISTAISEGHTDAMVIVTIHPYDIVESGEKLPRIRRGHKQITLQSVLDVLKRLQKTDAAQPISVATLMTSGEDLSIERWQANLRLKQSSITQYRVLPATLHLYPLPGLYYSRGAAERLLANQRWAALALYGGLALVVAVLVPMATRPIRARFKHAATVTGGAALAGAAALMAMTLLSGFHTLFAPALACCLGMLLGAFTSRLFPRR